MVEAKQVFIYFLRFVKVIAVLSLLLFGVSCGMIAKSSVESNTTDNQAKAFAVLSQAGFMVLTIVLILAEFGFKWFVKFFYLFHFWLGRGFSLGWLGIQAINSGEQIVSVLAGQQSSINPSTLRTIASVVGWLMISIGLLYIVMCLMCLQRFLGVEKMEDLENGFSAQEEGRADEKGGLSEPLNDQRSSTTTVSSNLDSDDLKLLSNAAAALGLTVRELRNRFGGPSGSRDAEKFFDEREKKLSAAVAAAQEAKDQMKRQTTAAAASSNKSATQAGPVAVQQSSTYEEPTKSRAVLEDDDDHPRKSLDDDDLEAAYYGGKSNAM